MTWYRYKNNKYNAKKTISEDHETGEQITLDSKKEAERYEELKILLKIGEIKDLKRQVRFPLTEEVREPDTVGARGGIHKGKIILRASSYVADFVYTDVNVIFFLICQEGRGASVLCAQVTAQTPTGVSLLRVRRAEHRVLSIRYTQRGVCRRVVQANYPGKSRKEPMFHQKLPLELGE